MAKHSNGGAVCGWAGLVSAGSWNVHIDQEIKTLESWASEQIRALLDGIQKYQKMDVDEANREAAKSCVAIPVCAQSRIEI